MAAKTKLTIKVDDIRVVESLRFNIYVTTELKKSKNSKPEYPVSKPASNQKFDNINYSKSQAASREYKIPSNFTKVIFNIRDVSSKHIEKVDVTSQIKKGIFSVWRMPTTIAKTISDIDNTKNLNIDTTEVAWYLVKKKETIDSFLNRALLHTPTQMDKGIFLANNSHLSGTPYLELQPGDIVVLSNTTNPNSTELKKMKIYAKTAKSKIEKLKRTRGFDPELFVYLSDLTTSTLSDADFVGVSSNPVPTEITNDNKDSDKTLLDYFADGSSAVITFSSQTNKDALKNFGTLVSNYNEAQGTKSGNSKHFSQFRTDNAKIYKALNNKLSLRFLKWDQGVRTDKLSKSIKSEMKRSTSFNGGLDAYVNNMEKNGKVTKTLKLGGNLVVGYNAFKGSKEIHDAYKSKNSDKLHKAVAIEPLKLSGSVIGAEYGAAKGAVVGAIIVGFTVGTGGIGGVVIVGLSAVIGGVGGGLLGGSLGEIAGNIVHENTRN